MILIKNVLGRETPPQSESRGDSAQVDTPLERREIRHITNPERAKKMLAYQHFRDEEKGKAHRSEKLPNDIEAVQVTKKDSEMRVSRNVGAGSYGSVDTVSPEEAGPISVRKENLRKGGLSEYWKLKREEKLLQRLHHPNIVKAARERKVSLFKQALYMEDGGKNLTEFFKALNEPLPQYKIGATEDKMRSALKADQREQAQYRDHICSQVLDGLEYLKSQGVIHRDIKPDNILIDPRDGQIRIVDFGEAVEKKPFSKMLDPLGTPAYVAPEIMALTMGETAEGYDEAADVFSAGCLFYEMVTGWEYLRFPGTKAKEFFANALPVLKERDLGSWLAKRINPRIIPSLSQEEADRMVVMLTGMLQFEPSKRFTPTQAKQALQGKTIEEPAVQQGTAPKVLFGWVRKLVGGL
ncbi:serine/threonine-protein kinase [Parendozoicomonas sp. Alg238-R29]|uniref:serine/threonine-protein kinase n=1 Tax=Parendozoicomonas sp. Alg238-R29 TaxID=2993446 RepID=UPI00248D3B87|nr:serine/threonine-protein kinase [Parendozoicomonas sp. Alg238-R29]